MNFLYRGPDGYVPVTRGKDLRQFLPYIRNTFHFRMEEFIRDAGSELSCCGLADLFRFVTPAFLLKSKTARVQYINDNIFRMSVVSFVDAYNFDMKAMQKECVHVITPDHHKIPFSAYNLLHRARYAKHYA